MDSHAAPRGASVRERPFSLLFIQRVCILSLLSVFAGWLCLQSAPVTFLGLPTNPPKHLQGPSGLARVSQPNGVLEGFTNEPVDHVRSQSSDGRSASEETPSMTPPPSGRLSVRGPPFDFEDEADYTISSQAGESPEGFLVDSDAYVKSEEAEHCCDCSQPEDPTTLHHVSFELASSIRTWPSRRELVGLWWRPGHMRGHVWIDKRVPGEAREKSDVNATKPGEQQRLFDDLNHYPEVKVSEDLSRAASFPADRLHVIRIARVVVEAVRLGLPNIRWFVMGDDDTIFSPENVVDLLSRYDHRAPLYLGAQSESQYANLIHGFSIAFGGGGFAISAPLARVLSASMNACIPRYPECATSDMWVAACAAEQGVSLTSEKGFHQMDLYGVNGFLEALPSTPLLSLHHLPANPPIFPNMDEIAAIRRLVKGMAAAPALFLQQALCVDGTRNATLSVAWGYSVKVFAGVRRIADLVRPARTFGIMAHGFGDNPANLAMDTRTPEPWATSQCGLPFVLHVDTVSKTDGHYHESTYSRHVATNQTECAAPIARLKRVRVIAERTFRQRPDGGTTLLLV